MVSFAVHFIEGRVSEDETRSVVNEGSEIFEFAKAICVGIVLKEDGIEEGGVEVLFEEAHAGYEGV